MLRFKFMAGLLNSPACDTQHYASQADFETAYPGLPVEYFEEAPVDPGIILVRIGPFDSTADDFCFSPGDI